MFRCDLLVDEDVIVAGWGELEPVDAEWLADCVIEGREQAHELGAPLVVDLREAHVDHLGSLDDLFADLHEICRTGGVSLLVFGVPAGPMTPRVADHGGRPDTRIGGFLARRTARVRLIAVHAAATIGRRVRRRPSTRVGSRS